MGKQFGGLSEETHPALQKLVDESTWSLPSFSWDAASKII
jgi:hypothetical protein